MQIIAITNRTLCRTWKDFYARIEDFAYAMKQGDKIILHEPDLSAEEYSDLAHECREICAGAPVRLVLSGHPAIAVALGIPRLHMPFVRLLEYPIPKEIASVYTTIRDPKDVPLAIREGATALIAGNVYESNSYPGELPKGIPFLQEVVRASSVPVYGIGGVSAERAPEVLSAGAAGVCVMSDFMTCDDVAKTIKRFRKMAK